MPRKRGTSCQKHQLQSPQRLGGHWTAQALVSVTSVWGKICNLLNVSDMCKVSLDEKLRFQVLREQKHGAKAIVVDITCGGMLETYHKLKKKLWSISELRTMLQKIWNEVPQKPVAKAVPNFRKRLQMCVN